jgi:acetoin utilization deacetylase AcuC-like enzyme
MCVCICASRSGTYHKLASRLQQLAAALCGGRLVFLLEGGYHTEAVGESMCEVFRALLGQGSMEEAASEGEEAREQLPHAEPLEETRQLIEELRGIHGL